MIAKHRDVWALYALDSTVKCLNCGALVKSCQSVAQMFCNLQCFGEYNRRHGELTGANNPNWRGGRTKQSMVCAHCGAQFQGRVDSGRGSASRYCSKECFYRGDFARTAPRWQGKFGRAHGGRRDDLGGIYFRSRWEANYARYLNLLLKMKAIRAWAYESKTFEFPVRRGTRFYTPDFCVEHLDGSVEYHEIKGYMHQKGATALKRMSRYHPAEKIVLIDAGAYRRLARKWRSAVDSWESDETPLTGTQGALAL